MDIVELALLATLVVAGLVMQAASLNFNYTSFTDGSYQDFIFEDAAISNGAVEVTPDSVNVLFPLANRSGRVFYNQQFKLWERRRRMKASFNSTFEFNMFPITSPGGEGLAFILSREMSLPNNSAGQWLGLMNTSTVGQPNNIVGVEFDTRKSYQDDIDDNHVGLDVNSIYSIKQEPLGPHGVNLSNPSTFTLASVEYDAKIGRLDIFLTQGEKVKNLVLTVDIDLSEHLPEDVFLGFSAATWDRTQLNTVRSWNFSSFETISGKQLSFQWIWILVAVIVLSLLGAVFFIYYWKMKRKVKQMQDGPEIENEIQSSSTAPQKFRLRELKSATGNFNSMYKLGKGGFGTVYKGVLSSKEVAVKRISKNSRHGKQDFIAEVTTIGNLHHKNLVKLIGWCYEKNELILVYELMPNGSLDKFIFCNEMMPSTEGSTLNWERRHSIICGVARALEYLHYGCEKRVLHRDIKASNIMLDSEFNARLGDFGLARTIQSSENTHYSTKEVAGTPGYMAPESFHIGRATVETDVYAFGVLVLEVVSGRKPGHQHLLNDCDNSIVDWVWENYRKGKIIDVVDTRLNSHFDKDQTECVLMLGLACCHPNPNQRPSTRTVVQVLTGEAASPVVPLEKPAFMWPVAIAPCSREETVEALSGGQLTQTIEFSGR